MTVVARLLGEPGVIGVIGIIVFFFAFKYSRNIFDWIERQTLGTRSYILEKFELLFIEVNPDHVTYVLLFLSFGLGIIAILFMGIFSLWIPGVFLGLAVSFFGWKIPKPVVNYMLKKRTKAYQGQMVDALTLLSNGIRAGLSVPQALAMVVDEMPAPISQEFNVILQQNKIGVPLEECFDNLVERVPTDDNEMFVSGVNILRETGGNLAETFDTIVGIIRERIRLQQKIDTYIAQGMFQGATIFCMPFAITGIFALSDPKAVMPLFTTIPGIIACIIALAFDIAGGIVILKIVKIEV